MDKKERNTLKNEGIWEKGYGVIPRLVMDDSSISVEAKAIYSYLASCVDRERVASPSVRRICSDLNIGEDRFYRHRKQLIEKGYIIIEKAKDKGRWLNNAYRLPSTPKSGVKV